MQWIEGEAVWQWRDGPGRWSIPLLTAALSRNPSLKRGRLEDNVKQPVVFLLEYFDGMRAASYMLEGYVNAWSFAAKLKSSAEPVSTFFEQGDQPGSRPFPHFDALVHCMEEMFISGKPLYPVERTLLTTCTLSMLFESRALAQVQRALQELARFLELALVDGRERFAVQLRDLVSRVLRGRARWQHAKRQRDDDRDADNPSGKHCFR